MTAKKPAKSTAKRTRRAPSRPTAVDDPGRPPLDAVDTPPATPAARTPNNARRGATAAPGPAELADLRARERLAVELAAAGVSDWDEIARQTGYANRSAAWKAVQRVLDRQEFAAVADYRRLMGYRLERILRANWTAAISGTESQAKDKATARVFKSIEQLRRVFGVDLETDKLIDALKMPADADERAALLIGLKDELAELRQRHAAEG